MSQKACSAEVVSADDEGMTEHAEEEVSGTEREAEREKFPVGQMTRSSHLSEPHVPQTNNSCLLCADIHDNLPMACSGQCHLTQSKHLNCVSFSCTFLPKNPLVIKLLNCSSLALVRPNGKLRPLLFCQTLLVLSPLVPCCGLFCLCTEAEVCPPLKANSSRRTQSSQAQISTAHNGEGWKMLP